MFGASKSRSEERAIQSLPWGVWAGEERSPSWSGSSVTTTSALQLQAVYGCNRFICEGISTLPVDAFRALGDGSSEEITKPRWLDQPTADLDFISWCTQVLTSLLLDGDAFCRLSFDDRTVLQEIVPLEPASVTVYREKGRKRYRVGGVDVDPFTVLHIPGIMRPGSDRGMSPVEHARQSIGKGLAVEEFSARFFGQGMNLAGVIEDPGAVDDNKARMMARMWARLHSGNSKSHLPGVLQGGAQWKPTGVTPEQSQFLQTQQFSAASICSFIFLIDPTEFGVSMDKGSSVTYANLEQRNVRKVQVTFLPWIVRIERALSSLLARPRYVKLNVNGLLRGDTKTRFETYEIASRINTSAAASGDKPMMLTAEMRDFEDLDPIDDADLPTPPETPAAAAPPSAGQSSLLFSPDMRFDFPEGFVNVGAPTINNRVEPTPVEMHNHVEQPAPIVNVTTPTPIVRVDVPNPPPPHAATRKRVEYDTAGRIVRLIEE